MVRLPPRSTSSTTPRPRCPPSTSSLRATPTTSPLPRKCSSKPGRPMSSTSATMISASDLDAKGCRFVTRLKKNTPVTVVAERPVAIGANIVCDKIVRLPERLAASRKNPFAKDGRMVVVTIDTGKKLTLFTNDLDSSAETIADLYKTRWQIELFFRWIKQNLKIRRFYGRSANAVRLQIAAAIITYLLLKLLHNAAKTKKTAARFFASVRHALFHRLEVETLVGRIERRQACLSLPPSPQLEFAL